MKFHVTLTHTPESCPLGHGEERPVSDWAARAKEVGIEIVSAVACNPAHTQFFVVETDDYSKLDELFKPWLGRAKADILPVRDVIETPLRPFP
jgi:hypothetical protein